jgi:hypothetical protein
MECGRSAVEVGSISGIDVGYRCGVSGIKYQVSRQKTKDIRHWQRVSNKK